MNIEKATLENKNYRKVLFTSPSVNGMQVVVMSLKPDEEIGMEVHPYTDQFIRVEKGRGEAIIGKINPKYYDLEDGDSITIPARTWHNIVNLSSSKPLQLYSIYTPPQHPRGLIQKNKPEKD